VYEYGVVFIPGTGAGTGPAYRHRPARNKYPVSENGLFALFVYKNNGFAKTGSGQT
jgi:hypothetical protein